MSLLTSELVKALGLATDAANKLTSEVAGKMKQIDQHVTKATSAVDEFVKSSTYRVVFVDSVKGNDKNNGSTAALAVRTISAAAKQIPDGFLGRINLAPGEYILDGDAQVSGKVITIVGRSETKEDYVVRSVPYREVNSSGIEYTWASGFRMGLRGVLAMVGVTLKTAYVAESDLPIMRAYTGSMINTSSASGVVLLQHTDIYIYHGSFMHQHDSGSFGSCDLRMRQCRVFKESTAGSMYVGRPFLIDQISEEALPYELYGTAVELQGFSSWSDAVRVKNANITSNLI